MGRPHRTLFQPTAAGTVARFLFLPERADAVKPDCAIHHAVNGITRFRNDNPRTPSELACFSPAMWLILTSGFAFRTKL